MFLVPRCSLNPILAAFSGKKRSFPFFSFYEFGGNPKNKGVFGKIPKKGSVFGKTEMLGNIYGGLYEKERL